MSEAAIIDGKHHAALLRRLITAEVEMLGRNHRLIPGLAVVIVGEDPASQVYVRNKVKYAKEAGIHSYHHTLDANITEKQLISKIESLNNDPKVHGILVQLPLPDHIHERNVIATIDPKKDVDGFHVVNIGKLSAHHDDAMIPCTPRGCMILLQSLQGTILRPVLDGYHAVVLGRSNIVGKPVAQLLLQRNCTVTILHSKSQKGVEICRQADIVISAMGRPQMIDADWIKPGAVVIDVGINRITEESGNTRLVGDIDFDSVKQVAAAITPVPGGVGPMTIACLLENTLKAACLQRDIPFTSLSGESI
jgi:methylenetetrahydrofolate dehydrogenase (NADP+)/methenyltetrahydrofolate cyclohydrolase